MLLLVPASALADGRARLEGSGSTKTLHVEAGPFDGQNVFSVNPAAGGTAFEVAELAQNIVTHQPIGLDAGADCTRVEANRVTCPASGVSLIRIETKGGVDRTVVNSGITVPANIDLGGDDDLGATGGGGNDVIAGGSGSEGLLAGGPGQDSIFGDQTNGGGNGDDLLGGDAGNDTLRGGDGDDQLLGGDGNDTLLGEAGVDDLRGLNDNDRLDGGAGADTFAGGPGTDRADYSARNLPLVISLNDVLPNDGNADDGPSGARDTVGGDVEDLVGGSAADTLTGNEGPNVLNGQGGDDVLSGQGGDDTLIGSAQADFLHGGSGTGDVAFYADHAAGVTVTMGDASRNDGNAVDQNAAGFRDQISLDVENVLGTAANDDLLGSPVDNVLDGGAGADRLRGGGGVDFVTYASRSAGVVVTMGDGLANDGNATDGPELARDNVEADVEGLNGTRVADSITGGDAANVLLSGAGADVVQGGGGDDQLDGGTGRDVLRGGSGTQDSVTYATRTIPVTVTLDNAANDGNADDSRSLPGGGDNVHDDVENVIGSSGADTLVGSALPNRLSGGPGNDTLRGGAGPDALDGSDDDDVLDGGADPDDLVGGSGRDRVDYSQRATPVQVTPDSVAGNDGGIEDGPSTARDTVVSVEDVTGGSAADTLFGSAVANLLSGGPGDDTLNGREGDDLLRGGSGADHLIGGTGTEDEADYSERTAGVTVTSADATANDGNAVDGPAGARDSVAADVEVLRGGSGNDNLTGGLAADRLFGGGGADSLTGASGNDALFGEAGDDTLVNGGSGGADALHGGDDTDLASYSTRTSSVNVTLDGVADDGGSADGFADNVAADVENVTGGAAGDTISGSDRANVLLGGAGADSLDSSTAGETASDTVDGGTGNDLVDANDGAPDQVTCGADSDGLTADLKDGPPGFADCEAVAVAAFDQHPTLEVLTDRAVVKGRHGKHAARRSKAASARIRIRCPDSPSHGCAGELSLRPDGGDGPAWASVPYALRARHRATLDLRLPAAVLDELRRNGRVPARVIATDRDTTGRPKTTAKTIELVAKGARG